MSSHPINLALRFILELITLYAMGLWGWRQSEGWPRYVLAVGIPLLFAIAWGTFAVPDDPSRSGSAPIPIPGLLRLILELIFFVIGVWMLHQLGYKTLSLAFFVIVFIHYLVSYDRINWLLHR